MKRIDLISTCALTAILFVVIQSCKHENENFKITYKDCYNAYLNDNMTEALGLLKRFHQKSTIYSNSEELEESAKGHFLEAYVYKKLLHPDSALFSFYNAIAIYKKMDNSHQVCQLTERIGTLFYEYRSFEKAYEYYYKGLELARDIGDEKLLSMALLNLAICSRKLGMEVEAIHYINRAIEVSQSLNDTGFLVNLYLEKGMCFYQTDNWSRARENYFKSLRLAEDMRSPDLIGRCLNNIGSTYLKEKEFSQAATVLDRAKEINVEDKRHMARVDINLGHYHNLRMEYEQAIKFYESAMDRGANMLSVDEANYAYDSLTIYFARKKDYKSALRYSQKLNKLNLYVASQRSKLHKSEKNFSLILAENVMDMQKQKEAEASTTIMLWSLITIMGICMVILIIKLRSHVINSRHSDSYNYYLQMSQQLANNRKRTREWMKRAKKDMNRR